MRNSPWIRKLSGKTSAPFRMAFEAYCMTAVFLLVSGVFASQKKGGEKTEQPAPNQAQLTQWHAFGSGCRSSWEKTGESRLNSRSLGEGLALQFLPADFRLALKQGLKGVRECALRLTVEPAANYKIKTVHAKMVLEATKSEGDRLRARILLLLGDSLVGRHEWDLQQSEFAKRRAQEIVIFPDPSAMETFKMSKCGQPQIVGLDFTFEGVRYEKSRPVENELATFRLKPAEPAEVEILFEKCGS